MCGRYLLRHIPEAQSWIDYRDSLAQIVPRYNIAPSQTCPVITLMNQSPQITKLSWGFYPGWVKGNIRPINARCERIWSSRLFFEAIHHSRCLVPADGFYEPKTVATKGDRRHRPWFLFQTESESPFMMAGITTYSSALNTQTFCIVTRPADGNVLTVHERMPVIIDEQNWENWLSGDRTTLNYLMLRDTPISFIHYPVSDVAKNPNVDNKACIASATGSQPYNLDLF